MIKFENIEVFGWEAAIRGMRNPMNSWDKIDSHFCYDYSSYDEYDYRCVMTEIGKKDLDLMKRLRNAGTDHRKFMRMITVYADLTAPLYWWKEFDTYKVGTVANSCSTMHKISEKEFTLDDFSHEHVISFSEDTSDIHMHYIGVLEHTVFALNKAREQYIKTKNKMYWWQMIQLLPSSYNQRRTVMMSYEVLENIYKSHKDHKLDEWRNFCEWIKTLPYSELITGEENKSCSEE